MQRLLIAPLLWEGIVLPNNMRTLWNKLPEHQKQWGYFIYVWVSVLGDSPCWINLSWNWMPFFYILKYFWRFFFILIQRKVLINKGYGINMNQCHHVRNSVQNVFNVMHQHIKNIKQSKPYLISRCSLIVGVATFK